MGSISFQIRREPGPQAIRSRNRRSAMPRLEELVHADSAPQALMRFARFKASKGWDFVALEWQGQTAWENGSDHWRESDGNTKAYRHWRLRLMYVSTSGLDLHEATFVAWEN